MNMSIFYKFNPVTFKFVQRVFSYRKMNTQNNTKRMLLQTVTFPKDMLLLSATLAFSLWPMRSKDVPEKKPEKPLEPVLEEADKLFDNGFYEECYNLLSEHQETGNIEVQWRICRALYNMSKESKYDKQYKNKLVLQAYGIIITVLNNTQDAQNHYAIHKWYALLLDAKSSLDGMKERIQQLDFSLPSLFIYEVANFVQTNPKLFKKMSEVTSRSRRDNNRLEIVRPNTALMLRSIFYLAPIIYNKIPKLIKELPNRVFKIQLKKFLLTKCYYSLSEFLND